MQLIQQLPGINSYRGRYLYSIAIALVVLSLFTYNSWKKITLASQKTHLNIVNRSNNTNTLNQIINQIPAIKVQIYQYSLDPEILSAVDINRSTTYFIELTSNLDISVFDDIDPVVLNNFIVQIPIQLHDAIIDLIAVRSDTSLWIPSTKIMSEQLSPINEQVIITLNAMLDDLPVSGHSEKIQLERKLLVLKNTWISLISEFRLIVANRFGFFGAQENGQSTRLQNLEILIPELDKQLSELELLMFGEDLEFTREVYFPKLRKDISRWIALHKKAIVLIQQRDWRKDIQVLHRIENLLENFNKTFVSLRSELTLQSINDIQDLNEINRSLSIFIIAFSLLALFIAVLGYLFFDRNLLRPIAKTTRALLLQSKGKYQELDIHSKASETRDLIEAFNQMSEKIKQRESRLDFIAHHDHLTQLPNRLLFNERLQHAVKLTQRVDRQLALMLLDLDRFKLINDTLGHLFGDKLLQQTAIRLKQTMRAEDTIARLGGDEFAIIIENISEKSEIEDFSKKIIRLFSQPFHIDEQEVHVSTSIGIAMAPLHSTEPDTLIRYADIAMYQSKNMGRNQYSWFYSDLESAEESMIDYENQLREAIFNNNLELHYQPLVDINQKEFISCEALLRWNHPERGLLHPQHFISILENSSLLFEITRFVIQECQSFKAKIDKLCDISLTISINLPSAIFQQKLYRDKIESMLLNERVSAESIIIEVTEDTLISDIKNTSISLNKLHRKGYKIALDDFGTGQSSLSHLRAFPIDIIKIDREFIRAVHTDKNDANLVSAIISLGHDLGMRVVAEGVELQEQLDFLAARGCHLIQGFYFSPPLNEDEFTEYLFQ